MHAGLLTLLINLDRSPDRLATMSERLDRLGLNWQRVIAVEGSKIELNKTQDVSCSQYEKLHGKRLNPSEVGCYMSHVKAIRTFLDQPQALYALILEDDVAFASDFNGVLDDLLKLHDHWDMVKLSGFHSGTPVGGISICHGSRQLAVMLSRHTGAACYLINRDAAQKYLKYLLPMYLPYDHMFDKGWEAAIKVRLVTPQPTQLDWEQPSTIGAVGSLKMKLPWHQRLHTYVYRLKTELRRFSHGVQQWLKVLYTR